MTTTDPRYAHLTDPRERQWLTEVEPKEVLANAHRFYEWSAEQPLLVEAGLAFDSYTREQAFAKASEELGIHYDVLYDAWLNEVPVKVCHCGKPARTDNDTGVCDQWPLCEEKT